MLNVSSPSFAGKTLILPAVSYGNVGQLAVDILLSTALSTGNANSAGHLQSRHLLPICGSDPFSIPSAPSAVATPCQLFDCPRANAIVMQRRSMCVKGRSSHFATELAAWCKEQKFAQVIVLAGADSGALRDRSMHESLQQGNIHYVTSTDVNTNFDYASWEPFTQAERDPNGDLVANSGATYPANVHMAGLSKKLYVACQELAVPVISLLCFVSEGYNVPDGVRLATSLCEHLPGLVPQGTDEAPGRWVIPSSWGQLSQDVAAPSSLFY